MMAYGFLSRDRGEESAERTVPIIMPVELMNNTADDSSPRDEKSAGGRAKEPSEVLVGAVSQFDDGVVRVSAYRVPSELLKKTVGKYAPARENQCSGEIVVRTSDTPLNVRSGPAVSYGVLSKAEKGSRQSVLLSATDEKKGFGRWFLLVDDRRKTVKGWVSGEYCDTSAVIFPD
jgi:hypothetical protein